MLTGSPSSGWEPNSRKGFFDLAPLRPFLGSASNSNARSMVTVNTSSPALRER